MEETVSHMLGLTRGKKIVEEIDEQCKGVLQQLKSDADDEAALYQVPMYHTSIANVLGNPVQAQLVAKAKNKMGPPPPPKPDGTAGPRTLSPEEERCLYPQCI